MKLFNLTPHKIVVYASAHATKPTIVIEPTGVVARVSSILHPASLLARAMTEVDHRVGELLRIPVSRAEFGEVVGLPAPTEGIVYVVSGMVLDAMHRADPTRTDLLAPGEPLRAPDGQILGCIGFRCS